MAYDGSLIFDTKVNKEGFEKGISGLKEMGSKSLDAIKGATVALGVAITGLGVGAVKLGSDFEAQMSRVKAISGATGEEFEKLNELAKVLGADTAFSASEAAAGMENLASAGFEANEIMGAMPGLLDLAAVSGGDVAVASEIAASALNAFGLEADQAAHIADVFARAAADTNAEVADMGEAMKYVGPVAKAMGLSIEEVAAAIGIMSDAGVKGSQAGTALRGALSRLAKPTKQMSDTMDTLGLSFYDSEGNMISLSDQIRMLQGAFEGLTQEERNHALVSLYGQESLSGMLALVEKGGDGLDTLTESLVNSTGAAAEMAAMMQDNLKGDVDELGGAFETLAIEMYQAMSGGMRDTVQAVSEGVDGLISAFKDKGGAGLAQAAGAMIGSLLASFVTELPSMIDTASLYVGAFFEGLTTSFSGIGPDEVSNLIMSLVDFFGQYISGLAEVGGMVVGALVGAIRENLPELLSNVVGWVAEIVSAFADGLSAEFPILAGILDGVSSAIQVLADNMNVIVPVVTALSRTVGALGIAWKAIEFMSFIAQGGSVVEIIKKMTTAFNLLSIAKLKDQAETIALHLLYAKDFVVSMAQSTVAIGKQIIEFGALAVAKIADKVATIATTVAQTALNVAMSLNPIGLIVIAIGALVAAFIYFWNTSEEFRQFWIDLWENIKSAVSSGVEAVKGFFASIGEAFSSAVESAKSFASGVVESVKEIPSKIKEKFLELVTGITEAFGNIKTVVGAKVKEVVTTAIQFFTELPSKIRKIFVEDIPFAIGVGLKYVVTGAQAIAEAVVNFFTVTIPEAFNTFVEVIASIPEAIGAFVDSIIDFFVKLLESIKEKLTSIAQAVATWAINVYETATTKISEMVTAVVTFFSELPTKVTEFLTTTLESIKTWAQSTYETMSTKISETVEAVVTFFKDLYEKIKETLTSALESVKEWVQSTYETMTTKIRETIDSVIRFFSELPGKIAAKLREVIEAVITWGRDMVDKAVSSAREVVDTVVTTISELPGKMLEIGKNIVQGLIDGITSMIGNIGGVIGDIVNSIKNGFNSSDGFDIHSPSRYMRYDIGENIPLGLIEGIEGKSPELNSRLDKMIASAKIQMEAQQTVKTVPFSKQGSAGNNGANSGGIQIIIEEAVIREEADITKLGRDLDRRVQRKNREKGVVKTE